MILLAIAPFGALLLLALGGTVAYVLLGAPATPPAVGTTVIEGAVGDLSVLVRQQTASSVEWFVRDANGAAVGSGAGTYEQAPLAAMLAVAFEKAGESAAVGLTYYAAGYPNEREKEHGDSTLNVDRMGEKWSWSVWDDTHDVVAMGEAASRGAALLQAEQAMAGHLGRALEGYGTPPAPTPTPDQIHGVAFHGCTVRIVNAAAWSEWARGQIVAAFDKTAGMPTPDDLLDETVATAMSHAGHPGCEIDELVLGTRGWAEVEPQIADLLEAIGADDYLSIPAPDEMLAAIMVGAPIDNRGTKERFGLWGIVVRPENGADAAHAFRWWAFRGARLLDTDAEVSGYGSTEAEALALAKAAVEQQPASVGAELKE